MNERAPPTPTQRRSWRRILAVTLVGAALCAGAASLQGALELYRREQRVRLYPTIPVPIVPGPDERALVLFLGDSRMQEWPDLPRDRFRTVNAGGGGETTAQIRLRAAATLEAVRPKLVVLQAGINDLKAIGALADIADEIERNCLANLSELVAASQERGAGVVLVPILPAAQPSLVRRLVWSPRIELARQRVNAGLRARFARRDGVALLDEHLLQPDTSADYRDTLHFRREAYAKLEAATLKAIAAL